MQCTYVIIHVRGTHKVSANIISPLQLICYCAIIFDLGAIVDEIVGSEQRCRNDPVVGFLRPVCIGLIAGVSG